MRPAPREKFTGAGLVNLPGPAWLYLRLLWPRVSVLTFFLFEPRGVVRGALGVAFLRAARLTFLRSVVSVIAFVFAINNP